MADCDPSDDFAVPDFKDQIWLRLSDLVPLARCKLVNLDLAVLAHQQAAWTLPILQLCNFDVGDWGFGLLGIAVELPEHDRFVRD